MNHYLASAEATEKLGQQFAQLLRPPLVIGFKGEIGMGKTSFIRAMLKQLGVQSSIKSPTFNLVETYETMIGTIHHFDLYRLSSIYDLEDLGFRDYLESFEICCIEWPENAPLIMPLLDLIIEFKMHPNGPGRDIYIKAQTNLGEKLISSLMEKIC
jgi:tRNA threonylcarbamoyladenosine biosynthesis protein TsaE